MNKMDRSVVDGQVLVFLIITVAGEMGILYFQVGTSSQRRNHMLILIYVPCHFVPGARFS